MPRRELKHPQQVEDWLQELANQLTAPARMTLIGSGALLWHAAQRGLDDPLPENRMDVDPITDSDEVARLCYAALIGSEFERRHGWHVNSCRSWRCGTSLPIGRREPSRRFMDNSRSQCLHPPICWFPSANAMNRATAHMRLGQNG